MQRNIALLFALALSLVSTPSLAKTYYVATAANGGSLSNPGTQSAPFLTIQQAANAMVAGETTIVENGTYVTQKVEFHTSGTPGNPITLIAQNKWQAILSSTSGCAPGIAVFASYITIKNLRIAVDPSNTDCPPNNSTSQNTNIWGHLEEPGMPLQ